MEDGFRVKIYDFDNIREDRTRRYGGMAGQKLGIILNNENWFLKFPKNIRNFDNVELSYATTPLSEYLGSKIYESIGLEVHQTELGIKDGKLVVACKDFLKENERLDEFRVIKNDYIKNLEEEISNLSSSGSGTDLEEIILVMEKNLLFKEMPELKERFYDMFIIDCLISNNDRNNGNWGVIVNTKEKTTKLAPIYDNGSAFNNKSSDTQLINILNDEEKFKNSAYNSAISVFRLDGKLLNPLKYIESLKNDDLNQAILRIVPKINLDKIRNIFKDIPQEENNITIMSNIQREFYLKVMEYRYENVLIPVYNQIIDKSHNK